MITDKFDTCNNDRLKLIDKIVDRLLPKNNLKDILKKYESILEDFTYIDSVEKFSILPLKGTMKYINKYDKKLRSGGILTKVFKEDDKWYAFIKQGNKFYKISYESNYIFYIEHKKDLIRNFAELFISEYEKNNYKI